MLAVCADPRAHVDYFENFLNNIKLLTNLKFQGFRATGTVRVNMTNKCPTITKEEMKNKNRGYSDQRFEKNNEIVCVKWHDNKSRETVKAYS